MNKIDKLLEEFCPEGVEYKALGEIGAFTRGSGLQKKDFAESGVGCIHYGQIYTYYGTSANETKSFVHPDLAKNLTKVNPGDIIIACTSENVEDVCKAVAWLGTTEIVTGGHACVFSHKENPKYISYFFQTENFFQQKKRYARGVKVIDVKAIDLAKIEIPLPPIEVQNEIVRILDKFASLAAELQAELQARQKQYEYYRDKLLTFTKIGGGTQGVTWMRMSEIGSFFGGLSGKSKADFINGNCKYITYMNVYCNLETDLNTNDFVTIGSDEKQNKLALGDVLFTGSSETPEECGMSSVICKEPLEKLYLNSFCFGYRLNDTTMFNPRFAKHLYRCN